MGLTKMKRERKMTTRKSLATMKTRKRMTITRIISRLDPKMMPTTLAEVVKTLVAAEAVRSLSGP